MKYARPAVRSVSASIRSSILITGLIGCLIGLVFSQPASRPVVRTDDNRLDFSTRRQSLANVSWLIPDDPPIKISAPRYRWLIISNQPATEFNLPGQRIKTPGIAMLRDEINISYDRGNYVQDKVKLVTEVTIANKDGKLTNNQAGIEREIKAPSGKLWAVWAVSGISVSGRGVMKIYLTENKKNGKTISNTLSIPVAADAAAEKELQSELGPWLAAEPPTP